MYVDLCDYVIYFSYLASVSAPHSFALLISCLSTLTLSFPSQTAQGLHRPIWRKLCSGETLRRSLITVHCIAHRQIRHAYLHTPLCAFIQLATMIPGRTDVQIRERYFNILKPSLSKDNFTEEEVSMSLIVDALRYQGGRNEKERGSWWSRGKREVKEGRRNLREYTRISQEVCDSIYLCAASIHRKRS